MPLASRRTAPSRRARSPGIEVVVIARPRARARTVPVPPLPVPPLTAHRRGSDAPRGARRAGAPARRRPRRAAAWPGRAARRRPARAAAYRSSSSSNVVGERLAQAARARVDHLDERRLAEQRLEQLLVEERRSRRRRPTSAPVMPPVCANVASITPMPAALTPIEAPFASTPLRRRRSRWTSSAMPVDPRLEAARSAVVEARARRDHRAASSATSSRVERSSLHDVAVRRAASRGVGPRERRQVGQRVLADLRDRRARRAADERGQRPAQLADAGREEARDLVRPDERLPLAQRLGAQERAPAASRSRSACRLRPEGVRRRTGGARRPRSPRARGRRPRARRSGASPARLPGERARGERAARLPVRAERVDARPDRRDGVAREAVDRRIERALGDASTERRRPRSSSPRVGEGSRGRCPRGRSTRSAASAGMRLTTTTSGSPRSRARASTSHGTRSA